MYPNTRHLATKKQHEIFYRLGEVVGRNKIISYRQGDEDNGGKQYLNT
jgi:hypothetical protein